MLEIIWALCSPVSKEPCDPEPNQGHHLEDKTKLEGIIGV